MARSRSTTTRDRATTSTGIALPLMALPQRRPETVDECAIPLIKATVWLWYPSSRLETGFRPQRVVCPHDFALPVRGIATSGPAFDPTRFRTTSNVSIASAAPHSAILRHAGLVVTHGGSDRPSLVWLRKPSHVRRLRSGECPYAVLRYQLASALS